MNCKPVYDREDDGIKASCANCGKQGSDIIKLKNCTACRLVKYCGADCQRAHRKLHKKACKQRAAELKALKDEQLYSQGHERPEEDFCPICTLPIPLPMHEHSAFELCCMKRICYGCKMAAVKRGIDDCPFCRTAYPCGDAESLAMVQARVAKKDPDAINFLGEKYYHGLIGLQKDVRKAVALWEEAAELGSIKALYHLGIAYCYGEGVEKNMTTAAEFFNKSAMRGYVKSRYLLGSLEGQRGNYIRAVRHYLISAKMGDETSVEVIKKMFIDGDATKEQYAEALKGYQDAVEETKSHDRDESSRLSWWK